MAFPPENRQKRLQAQETPPQMQPDRLGHVFTSNSLEACLEFIRATDAVLIHTDLLSGFFAEQGIEQVETLPDELVPRWMLGIYVLPERRDDPHMLRLIERIRNSAATDGLAPM